MLKRGKFIVFEGGDGAGKTTQLELLASYISGLYGQENVICTREPGGTALGKQIRELLLHGDEVTTRAEALLYAADRAQHLSELVLPALAGGVHVVQDRYIDSSIAYQSAARGLDSRQIIDINKFASGGLRPDLTILLDIDPALGDLRRACRASIKIDRIEAEPLDFHKRVREQFLTLAAANPQRYEVIDATQPIEQIQVSVRARVAELFNSPAEISE